ncbi:Cys-tRNA(Pro) deacylase [Planococcus sp. S3-L1]|uniref:Cys-tRNA(Pro) deacylase n=1 Tax=Planococcus sp. S3-L1 TaxID=3046200 RepID=UPI0024B8B860|nr:Cys-tRNA(Pro) deacylase [Planococcus sp. S3-L1]MDJ0330325.1 Cys-tRNA(Pro) deacylase [Planococcus sp. S3-L1]
MAKKMVKTNAARMLDKSGIYYELLHYRTEDGKVDGVSVAAKIGFAVEFVYKTLVATGASKQAYVFVIPVAEELDFKKAAKATGEKKIEMLPVKEILTLTGYIRGGCSPVGMKKPFPTFISSEAGQLDEIIVSAGKIGVQLKLAPNELLAATTGQFAELTASSQ